MAREGSRCAITKVLDDADSSRLLRLGSITAGEAMTATLLEGAHIIPHGLGEVDPSGALVSNTPLIFHSITLLILGSPWRKNNFGACFKCLNPASGNSSIALIMTSCIIA
jgi:hypothetical protein